MQSQGKEDHRDYTEMGTKKKDSIWNKPAIDRQQPPGADEVPAHGTGNLIQHPVV
jgi:hypothetical protein